MNIFIELLVTTGLFIFLIEKTMNIIFKEQRTSSFYMWTSFIFVMIIMTFFNSFIPQNREALNPSLNMLGMLVFLLMQFLLTFNYKSSMIRRITTVGIIVVLDAASAFLSASFSLFFPIQLSPLARGFLAHFLSTLVLYIILVAISQKSKGIRKNTFDSKKFSFLILLPFLTFFSLLLYVAQAFTEPEITFVVILFIFIIVFAFMYLVFTYYNNASESQIIKLKAEIYEKEKDYYLIQCQMMEESVEQMKAFRHDIKLHLATLENYVEKSTEEALTYIKQLTGGISNSEVYSDTGNIALDSIINFKLQSIKTDGVEVGLNIFAPATLGIEASDLVIIIGNLLDNALEAVAKVADKRINITVAYQKGNLLIQVENTFDGTVKIDKKHGNLTTLKTDDGHGYGLRNIHKSADKYHGTIELSHENNWFIVEVLLYCLEMK